MSTKLGYGSRTASLGRCAGALVLVVGFGAGWLVVRHLDVRKDCALSRAAEQRFPGCERSVESRDTLAGPFNQAVVGRALEKTADGRDELSPLLHEIMTSDDARAMARCRDRLSDRLAELDRKSLPRVLAEFRPLFQQGDWETTRLLMTAWARFDALSACEYAVRHIPGELGEFALATVLAGSEDPFSPELAAYMDRLPRQTKIEAAAMLVERQMTVDLAGALRWTASLGDPEVRRAITETIVRHWAEWAPMEAMNVLASESGDKKMLAIALRAWMESAGNAAVEGSSSGYSVSAVEISY